MEEKGKKFAAENAISLEQFLTANPTDRENLVGGNKTTTFGKAIRATHINMLAGDMAIQAQSDFMNLKIEAHLLKTKGLIGNPTAKKVLPTTAGCFFGSTEYDEWYWENLEYTSKRIKAVLNYQETQNEKDDKNKQSVGKMFDAIYYRASW